MTFMNFRTYCILLRTLLNSLTTFTNFRTYCILLRTLLNSLMTFMNFCTYCILLRTLLNSLTTFMNFRTYCILLRTLLNSLTTFTNFRTYCILISMFITKTQCVIQNTTPVIYYFVYLVLKDTKDYSIVFLLNPSFRIHCLNGEISNICMCHF